MFRTKKDVDAHVRDVFSKCVVEPERVKLCFGIAKQYAGIKEFESARRYIDTYINSNPANMAEAQKLFGDILLELGDGEKALERYKISYSTGKRRDSLNRVCDLLARGFGILETPESKKHWLELQKSSTNNNAFTASSSPSPASSMPRRTQTPVGGGPPKTGFSHHASFTNGTASPLSSANKSNGANVDLQLRYLERRFDDGLGKILDQNTMVLEQMLRLKEDIRDLSDKMEQIAFTQQKMQTDMKEIQDKEKSMALTSQMNQLNAISNASSSKCVCEDRSHELKAVLSNLSSSAKSEYTNLKDQMEKLEKLTLKAIDNYNKDIELRKSQPVIVPKAEPQGIPVAVPPSLNQNNTMGLFMGLNQPQLKPQLAEEAVPAWRSAVPSEPKPLSEIKKPEGSWTCGTCYSTNENTISKCIACQQCRPGFESNFKPTPAVAVQPQPSFNFGFPSANPITPPTLNFGMTTSTPVAASIPVSVVDGATPKKSDENKDSPIVGVGGLNLAGKFSFSDLAKNNNSSFTFGGGNTETPSFAGAGAPLFSSLTLGNKSAPEESGKPTTKVDSTNKTNTSANAEEGDDDFVPTAEFQPVIPLPPLVEVKKGDENENTVAEYRAKLFRFVSETKEWKERGIGNIKLLQSKDDLKKCRVVMWREKIGKLACNFNLFPDIIVTNYQGNPKVLCWKCQDHAEDPAWETFTLKFGNEDNCAHFKREMERLAKMTIAVSDSPKKQDTSASPNPTTNLNGPTSDTSVPLSQLFKKPEGSWNCDACYCNNNPGVTVCAACQTCRPGYEDTVKSEPEPATVQPTFSFGFPTAKPITPPTLSFGVNSTSTPVSTSETVTDGVTPKRADENKDSPFAGLNLAGKFSFSDLAKNNNSSFTFGGGNTETPSFAGAGAPLFTSLTSGNQGTSFSDQQPGKGDAAANSTGNAEEGDDDFVPTAEFQPVIPLPPLVEVKKGDENENTVAEYRAKLFRFVSETKEWKERGIGNIKLLQSKDDLKKCRVVMWREKIGKLACNFNLFPDIIVTNYQGNPKVLCWKCQDHAEDPAWETFTLKFGNEDNCAHFKQEMERLAKMTIAVSDSPKKQDTSASPNPTTNLNGPTSDTSVPLSQLFKKPEGSWNCDACYCNNNPGVTVCAACQTCRPGYEDTVKSEPEPATVQPTFSFGFPTAKPITPPTLSFGVNSTSTPVSTSETVTDGVTPKRADENKDSPFAGLNLAGKFSFSDLAKNNNSSFTFGGGNTETPSFAGAGAPLFTSLTSGNQGTSFSDQQPGKGDAAANSTGNAEEGDDDFVPTAEFQPVIPLPPLVEVKKGDENENTVAEYRAKLFRFVSETKEWKERGIGNIKLLQSKDDLKKCRVVMWREKIGKLACNFNLFPDIIVTNYQGNPKVLCWKCQDHAEDPAWETFTLKFGNEDNCAHFKQEMERLAKMTIAVSDSPKKQDTSASPNPTTNLNGPTSDTSVPLSQLFKKPEGSWNCDACYCNNNPGVTVCAACQTCRPGYEDTVKSEPEPATVQPTFSFGFPTAKPITPPTLSFGISSGTPAPTLASANTTAIVPEAEECTLKKSDENKDNPFAALNLAGKFSFADLAKNNNSSFTFGGGNTDTPSFAGAGAPQFSSLNVTNKSTTETLKDANTSADAEDGEDDFVPTVDFQPVIPLPPLVEVKKGDENENTIVEYRAKLYRFVSETKEWKERGIGNIKLLQSKDDPNKCRVVMWREKIGKLACNFSLFPDITITNYQGNPKVLCWKCQDCAEETAWETFTLRFGNEENCDDFKNKLLEYAKGTTANNTVSSSQEENLSCPGCVGCDSDGYKFPDHQQIQIHEEASIDIPLAADSSVAAPLTVSFSLFDQSSANTPPSIKNQDAQIDSTSQSEVKNDGGNLSSFSFSLKTPEKNASPISFQFKSPDFSFKSPAVGNSPSIFGGGAGSIFSPPLGTPGSGTAASPFVSPFSQPPMGNNDGAPQLSSPFNLSHSAFQQNMAHANANEEDENNEHEEDEYEDVDDEDECMFEDDAHIFIQDNVNASEGFSDKGEGVVRVLYDGESYCARLVIIVDDETIAEHLVAVETLLEPKDDRTYEWTGVCNYESPIKSRIKVKFSSDEAFQNFSTVMADGLEFAEQAGITEGVLMEESGY